MTKVMHRVLNDIKTLSQDEKNDLLTLLISSMDENHDKNSDEQWAKLAQERYKEIESNSVQTTNWENIKNQVLSK